MSDDRLATVQRVLGDRYVIQRELGRGGMAVVYLAEEPKHNRLVAIKVLRPEIALEVGPERFTREIEVTAQLSHPHVLGLYDSGGEGSVLYYVMPYVEGESLRDRLDREGQLPIDDALAITRDVASALAHAHSRGIIHRDVKPENILLSGGQAVVADFGIAGVIASESGLTRTGMVVGTPAYMSPEQASGNTQVDGRSDQYALACVLYEMLGGEPPHTGPSPQAILARQLSGEVRALRPLRHAVTPAMEKVVRRALEPSPADRYASTIDFAEALRRVVGRRSRASEWVLRVRVRRRWWIPAGAALAAVAAGIAGALLLRGGGPLTPTQPGIAVFPFRATGGAAEEWTEQLPDLLSTILDGTPGLRVADPWALWRPLRPTRDARAQSPADPAEAARLARAAGVDRYLLGAIRENDGFLQLSVRVYGVERAEPVQSFVLDGSSAALDSLAQRVAIELIARMATEQGTDLLPTLNQYATVSADALKAFLLAREAARRGQIDSAEAAIDRALALDSTFALGIVEAISIKSVAYRLRGEFFNFLDLAERAAARADGLSERNRLRIQAVRASVRTDGTTAAAALGRLLEIDSTDVRAWYSQSYVDAVYGWQFGRGPEDALEALNRAIALDPTFVPALTNHAELAVALRGPDAADDEYALLLAADTANALSRAARYAMRAVGMDDASFAGFTDSIAALAPREWAPVLRVLRGQRPDRTEAVLEALRTVAAPGPSTFQVDGTWARLAIAEGRLREVDSLIAAGGFRTFDQFRWVQRLLVGSALTGIGDTAVARRAVDSLAAYVRPETALDDWGQKPVWWTGWLVAAYHAMYGDTTITARWRETIGTFPAADDPDRDYRGALQSDLAARLLARRGELDSALVASGTAHRQWLIHTENDLESTPASMIRFQSAMLLLATGQADSAASMFRSLVPPTSWFGPVTARAALELGRIEAERGRLDEAARHLQTALRLWERGGEDVRAWRDLARGALEDIVAERGGAD